MTPTDTTSRDEDQQKLIAQVRDLRAEGDELYNVLKRMDSSYWTQVSTFKDWTIWDVLAHLHFSDYMALTCLKSASDFKALKDDIVKARAMGGITKQWLMRGREHALPGPELLQRWRTMFIDMCEQLAAADPNERFVWVGPGMKARMFTTARQMETWAHGWEVYDLMGLRRKHSDRLRHIATIGVRTYAWTFTNRKLPVPEPAPYVRLQAPSGAIWEFNDPDSDHRIGGSALEFCQVVTQVRNVADTRLTIQGDSAVAWMNIAQCFAGPPEDPPTPGSRVPAWETKRVGGPSPANTNQKR
jgi:uncharacterized protein (TIGR03084 family)